MPIPSGSIPFSGQIHPTDTSDTYPLLEDTHLKGSYRVVASLAERDSIPAERRKEGMVVFVASEVKEYQLIGGLTNASWVEKVGGGGGSSSSLQGSSTQTAIFNELHHINSSTFFSLTAGALTERKQWNDFSTVIQLPTSEQGLVVATSSVSSQPARMIFTPVSLTGTRTTNLEWLSSFGNTTNQRINVNVGASMVINRFRFNNAHTGGAGTNVGARKFSLWGSNTLSSFQNSSYADDTGWTKLGVYKLNFTGYEDNEFFYEEATEFRQHVASDTFDFQEFYVFNNTPYRYYSFKIENNWGHPDFIGIRRIDMGFLNNISIPGVFVHNNTIRLPQGKFLIQGSFPGYRCGSFRVFLSQVYPDPAVEPTAIHFLKSDGGHSVDNAQTIVSLNQEIEILRPVAFKIIQVGNVTNASGLGETTLIGGSNMGFPLCNLKITKIIDNELKNEMIDKSFLFGGL